VTVTVDGTGKLLGLDNADQNDTTPLRSPSREPRDGRLLALIQAAGTTGTITVTAEAEGLEPLELQIQVD
jgi:beta-galactosidase